jgi:molybdopterin-dependent oxidoreductase alpha subunit
MGGNFLSASPDTDYTAEALQNCALTVQVSTKLNRAHLVTGDAALILPCLGRTERDEQPGGRQFVTVENSMGIVHTSRGKRAPASAHLLSEPRIVARLAEATLPDHPIDWSGLADDYGRIRDHISRVIGGFEDYNRRVVQPGGFALPHPVRDSLTFPTPSGKAHFTVHDLPDMGRPDGALWMFTVRSHDQYNTTIYATDDRYRGIRGERRVVLMHTADMRERGLSEGDRVTLVSHFRGEQRRAPEFRVVAFDVPKGSAATYFPEANVLVPVDSYARKSHTPTSKAVLITVESPT